MNNVTDKYSIEFLNDLLLKASDAFKIWSIVPIDIRAKYLHRLRTHISLYQDKIIDAISRDTLKPVTEIACQEVTSALEMVRYVEKNYPKWLRDKKSAYLIARFLRKTNIIRFEPKGIFAIIGPSNFPFTLMIMQAAASIICGNCVILKPSEKCPHVSRVIKEVINESGFPEGVFGVAEGNKQTACELISSKFITKVIFTGSYQNGMDVAGLCGKYFKQCILELGGYGTAIICKDANIVRAAKCIAWSASYCRGQSCIGTRIVLAEESVFEEFSSSLENELRSLKAGDPFDTDTDINFNMKIEQTGEFKYIIDDKPALVIKRVKSIEQSIAETNNSEYGLSVSVWSNNLKSAQETSKQIKAGMVWINDCSTALPDFPWGGIKNSGWGRLYSKEAINELTNLKIISIDRSRSKKGKTWWFPYNKKKYNIFKAVNSLLGGKIKLALFKELIFKSKHKTKAGKF